MLCDEFTVVVPWDQVWVSSVAVVPDDVVVTVVPSLWTPLADEAITSDERSEAPGDEVTGAVATAGGSDDGCTDAAASDAALDERPPRPDCDLVTGIFYLRRTGVDPTLLIRLRMDQQCT